MQGYIRQHAEQPASAKQEQTVAFVNKSLEQAARTFTGDFTPPTEEEQAKAMAAVAHLLQPKAKRFEIPEGEQDKMECWHGLYNRFAAGETLPPDEYVWFAGFAQSYKCKAYCKIHGLAPVEVRK
ncbi:MAG: hypothetical protein LBC94_04390 [Desulfovibrio sp.]|jgi:hypothetical protein|nr:hypothetical protein [Desulfovibrio sp.]